MAAGSVPAVVPDGLIEERRRLGLDQRDEMWGGVLHMVPPASSAHNRMEHRLAVVLDRAAEERRLWVLPQSGVFDPQAAGMTSYRVPDLAIARPEVVTDRGIEGAASLVVEVLSTGDGAYEKLPFYRAVGVEELLFVDPRSKAFEVRRPDGAGWSLVAAEEDGWTSLASLDVRIRRCGDVLQVRTDGGIEEV